MEEQYLKAVDLAIKIDASKLAGLTLAELGECFYILRKHEYAHRYYIKSARILQNDFFHELALMKRIIINSNHYKDMNEPLSDLFQLWQPFCRKYPKRETEDSFTIDTSTENVRMSMRSFEIDFILISLIRYLTQNELGKSILPSYDGTFKTNLRTSILTKDEFIEMSNFIDAVQKRDKYKASDIYIKFLLPILDDVGKTLVKEVINLISEVRHAR